MRRPSSWSGRPRRRCGCRPDGYSALAAYLDGGKAAFDDPAFREAVLAEESLLVVFGAEFSGAQLANLVAWGLKRGNVRFAYLGDYANSRGAADMGVLPDLLPGYLPVAAPGAFAAEYAGLPATPGKSYQGMFDAAAKKELGALLVVGADPVAKLGVDPATLKNTFVIVQDIFLTETAALADVVLPAASLYEKSGTVTNTFGDVQLVKKAADRAGVKPDFEILVRLAGAMGVDVKSAGSVWQGRRDGRPRTIARRAGRRGGQARGLAGSEWIGAEAEPLRSAGGARRNCPTGSGL